MKNSYRINKPTLLFCCAIFCLPLSVSAEVELQKIEVVGGAQEERRRNAEEMFLKPYSKEIIGEKTIIEENIADIAEAVKDVSGVSVTESGSFAKTIKVRGLYGPRVATLINGIRLSNQGMTHSGAGQSGKQDIANVKIIEVIKGSPAVIFDPGASGGVINIITHKAPQEKGLSLEQRVGYDQGYDLRKYTTILEGSTGKIGGRISYTKADSKDYKIGGDEEDKKFLIEKVNFLTQDDTAAIPVDNLGYNTDNINVELNIKAGEDGVVDLSWSDWIGKDMSIIHGATIYDAGIIQYDRMTIDTKRASYRKEELGWLRDLNIQYAQMRQNQIIGASGDGVILNSKQLNFISNYFGNNYILKFGAEARFDDAKTRVYSEQDYFGLFVNGEYLMDDWTFFAGIRSNHWTTEQKLLDGTNRELAGQLVGISGITPKKTVSSPTMAIGAQYLLNERNSISVNLNTTYRNPDLMERYSFSGVLGGGLDLKAEEGKHAELSWKYLDNKIAFTSSIFYSDFKDYIWRKQVRRIIDQPALLECIRLGNCNPATGDYDDRETDFFDIYSKFYNAKEVNNWGIEANLQYSIPQHEVLLSSSFNKITSDDKFVKAAAQPISTSVSYRYEFQNSWKPWAKIKGTYTLDYPKVEQYRGFDPYFVANIYAGFRKNNFTASAGVRNILDTVYHTPYSGINSLARTFFVNVSYKWR